MCKTLDQSKAFPAQALLPNEVLITNPTAPNAMNGTMIPCACGEKMFFKPDKLDNIVEVVPSDYTTEKQS